MITSKHIDAQGNVALWEATDDGHNRVMMPATDAAHALAVDPDRWSLESRGECDNMDPGPQPAPESDQTPASDDASKQGSG